MAAFAREDSWDFEDDWSGVVWKDRSLLRPIKMSDEAGAYYK